MATIDPVYFDAGGGHRAAAAALAELAIAQRRPRTVGLGAELLLLCGHNAALLDALRAMRRAADRPPPRRSARMNAVHEPLDPAPALRVRTVWISDLHLGTPGCRAPELLEFLRRVDCDTLYLVGDVIDGWQLRRTWYWPQSHNDVVQKVLRKARKGTRVVYVPGNHDEFARRYVEHSFGGVEVVEDCLHLTADGRRLWITHGDLFDGVVQCAKWLAHLGDAAYEFTLRVNRWFNAARARMGLPYWSLSRYLKLKVKRAVSYVGDFEAAVAREAKRRGAHGVVCGHIHHAEIRDIDGVLYCNDGDWVESLTALVEHPDGRLEILDFSEASLPGEHRRASTPRPAADAEFDSRGAGSRCAAPHDLATLRAFPHTGDGPPCSRT